MFIWLTKVTPGDTGSHDRVEVRADVGKLGYYFKQGDYTYVGGLPFVVLESVEEINARIEMATRVLARANNKHP